MEIIVFFWLAFAIIVGAAANTRGRDGVGWFVLAVLISPVLAGLLLLALPRFDRSRAKAVAQAPMKKCPYCAQMIPIEALVCHLCRREVDTPESAKVLIENESRRQEHRTETENEKARKARWELIAAILIIIGFIVYVSKFK